MSMQEESFTKQDYIFNQLSKRILSGQILIGDQIPIEEDLAKEFHCSRGTVARAVARLVQEGLVERKTRSGTRVIKNTLASNGTPLDLDACAFIYPNEQHEGIWKIMRGFQQAAYATKSRTIMLSTGMDFRKEAEVIGRLGEFNVRGAVLFPVVTTPAEMAYYTQMILSCPFPIVLAELKIPGIGRPSVVVDGFHAGYTMTKHLLGKGLRKVGFISVYAWTPFMHEKYLGYRQALEEYGIEEDTNLVLRQSEMVPNFEKPLDETRKTALAYFDKKPNVEGVVCSNDFVALGLIRVAQERGMKVPEDLKVTGIDDFEILSKENIPLTTYHMPYEKLGVISFEKLRSLMSGSPLAVDGDETQIRGEIVVRKTT